MMWGAMNTDWLLSFIAAIAGFFLKTTLAFGVCAALSRLVDSAKLRFNIWSGFVFGSAAYWLYLANVLWTARQQSAKWIPVALEPVTSSFATWQVPSSWAFPLALTLRIMGCVYLLTLCYFTFSHLRKRHHLKWVLSFTSEPPVEIAETFRSVARELRASRSRLLLLSGATSPATFGWLRPIVLLPSSCVEQECFGLEDILRHELHHVHRRDAIWNELAVAARGLLFFHPAVWYAVRKMQFDRELACDFAVVARSPARRAAYAECLVRFAQLSVFPEHSGWGIDFAASAHHLTVRVHSILAAPETSPNWVRCLRVASGLIISALFLGVAPSLAILLSFAHPPLSHTAFTQVVETPSGASANANRTSRRNRSSASSAKEHGVASGESSKPREEDRPAMDLRLDTQPVTLPSQTSSLQLRRRGAPSAAENKGATSQTIALTDTDAKGQPAKSGDSKQAVQQTATAAFGIYKRLSALDRH
jgi:beta-lactamase regulating signal transducer with metallopeptidase domain